MGDDDLATEVPASAGRRRHDTAALLVAMRELGIGPSRAAAATIGEAYVTNTAILVLTHLAERDVARSGTLARIAHLTRGGMSNMLKRFEDDGTIARAPGPDDGRSVVVALTSEGRELEARLCSIAARELSEARAVVKQVIVLLVELGASSTAPSASPSPIVDRQRRVTASLATAGTWIGEVLATVGTPAEAMTLAALDAEGPCRARRVGQMLGLTSGGATRLLDGLEAQDLVVRRAGTDGDGRAVTVSITPAGERRLDELADALRPRLDALLDVMRSTLVDLDTDR